MAASVARSSQPIVVDAEGHVVGRLASHVAKLLLRGDRVVVVNAEKALFSGKRGMVLREWLSRLEISSVVNPKFGPFHPRAPDRILRRVVRGMVPRRKAKGVQAMKRLRVYLGVPEAYARAERQRFPDAEATKPPSFYLPLAEVAQRLGWKRG